VKKVLLFIVTLMLLWLPVPTAMADTGTGVFSINCPFGFSRQADPIVSPGVYPSGHMHDFFGNTSTNENSTYASMTEGGTSCPLTADKAGYWSPSLVNIATGALVVPSRNFVYYQNQPVTYGTTQTFPPDFRMVAGGQGASVVSVNYWNCSNESDSKYHPSPSTVGAANDGNCGTGFLRMHISFPPCWDGVNLDSADHRSHMAYPVGSSCPAAFPVKLPHVTMHIAWAARGFEIHNGNGYQLSDGTVFPHADFWQTWVPTTKLDSLVAGCLVISQASACKNLSDAKPGP